MINEKAEKAMKFAEESVAVACEEIIDFVSKLEDGALGKVRDEGLDNHSRDDKKVFVESAFMMMLFMNFEKRLEESIDRVKRVVNRKLGKDDDRNRH